LPSSILSPSLLLSFFQKIKKCKNQKMKNKKESQKEFFIFYFSLTSIFFTSYFFSLSSHPLPLSVFSPSTQTFMITYYPKHTYPK
jgi:hypothetical protein